MLTQSLISLTSAIRILTAKLSKFGRLVNLEKLTRVRGKIYNAVYTFLVRGKVTRCAHFLSITQFEADFVKNRQEKSQALVITPQSDSWEFAVSNPEKNTTYKVQARHPGLSCACQDYIRQRERNYAGRPIACKHGYAVLGYLGFASLEDYVNRYTGPDDVEIDEMIQYQYEAWQDARACLGY
jgi:hypothetical protein